MPLRNYSNTAPPVSLTVAATAAATTLTVASTTGYPAAPFLLGLERGTANEEVVLCTALTATVFTVTRGYDGTSAKAHNIGSSVEHTVAAIDYHEATRPVRVGHTFSVPGTILAPSGQDFIIPGFYVPVPAGRSATIVGGRGRVQAGTSATISVQKNGTTLTGTAGTVLTSASGNAGVAIPAPTAGAALGDGDFINILVTAVSGTPQNLTATIYIDYGPA